MAPVPAPARTCDLVTVPTRQGLEAVDILRRAGEPSVGPVLHNGAGDTLGFLVPSGTASDWDMPGSACTGPSGSPQRGAGAGWLLPPGDAEALTDPGVLRMALGEAARLLAVADNCA
ncbi:hypothetical protein ACFVIM_26075 [Streptomyces sp. NPDC057638]|uniref:hypothetical protein n=1 Tax=Streptomyces sp. NPDC057638 TaxID=3346190 RepID=UPI003683759C